MKNQILLAVFLMLFTNVTIAQIPSINQNYTNYEYKIIANDTKSILAKLKEKEKEALNPKKKEIKLKQSALQINRAKLKNLNTELDSINSLTRSFVNTDSIKKIEESLESVINKISIEKKQITDLKIEVKKAESTINNKTNLSDFSSNAFFDIVYKEHYQKKIKIIDDKITAIKSKLNSNDLVKIKIAEKKINKLSRKKTNIKSNEEKFSKDGYNPKFFFPSYYKIYREYFFATHYNSSTKKTNFINTLSFIKNNNNNTLTTELVTDNISLVRISLGSVLNIASSESEVPENPSITEAENGNIEKLLNGGGNFYLDFILPVFSNYNNSFSSYYAFLNLKLATDIKGFDSDISNTTANFSFGFSHYAALSSENEKFNFALSLSSNLHYGLKDFRTHLDLPNKVFFNTNITGFITINNKFRIALRTNIASEPSIRSEKVAFGLQLLN